MRRVALLILPVLVLSSVLLFVYSSFRVISAPPVSSQPGKVYLPLVLQRAPLTGDRLWDPRLDQRGAFLIPAHVQPGQGYWRLETAVWYAENEPPFAGMHHILIDTLDGTGNRQVGVPIRVTLPDGLTELGVVTTEAKTGELYAANFPMWEVAPFYQAAPADGAPADAIGGMGMGSIELPTWKIHTSYGLVWRWTVAATPIPTSTATATPTATPSETPSATAVANPTTTSTVTANFTPTATPEPSPTSTATPTVTAAPSITATPTGSPTPSAWPQLVLVKVTNGLAQPINITYADDGSGEIYIAEQHGRIRVVKNGSLQITPFLDISSKVSCCGERGLLGVAFPPGYVAKRYFYVDYTDLAGNTVIARYHLTADPGLADPASEEILLSVLQPYSNHNGGQIAFGPRDGYLYIGMGDGGSAGDPGNRAQNPAELLGKLLRIDAESGSRPYAIPPTNPFTQTVGYRGEIWAMGLRNPWRFSFDRQTDDLYIGDVGQDRYEEVDFQPATSLGGTNYGWRIMEGLHCYNPADCAPTNLTLPVAEYDHSQGCSITGGMVYRGTAFTQMQGIYFYADYCSGRIWGLRHDGNTWRVSQLDRPGFNVTTFGEDEAGEIYVADYTNGIVYRITAVE